MDGRTAGKEHLLDCRIEEQETVRSLPTTRAASLGTSLLEQNDEWAVSRRYMTLESIAPLSDGVPITLPTVAA